MSIVGKYGFKDSESRRTAKLHDWFISNHNFDNAFSKNSKNLSVGMWGVYPEATDWNIASKS